MQYRFGNFTTTSTPTALTLYLGFKPDHFNLVNLSAAAYTTNTSITKAEFYKGMAVPSAIVSTTNATPLQANTVITTNGFTPFSVGGLWLNTVFTITGISAATPAVVTVQSATLTNGLTLANGMTFTISSVVGCTNLNTRRFIVSGLSGTTFNLYDEFGNPVTAIGTYVSGGQMDVISYPPTAPVLNPTTGQVVTPGFPAGLQYDTGGAGIILGTALFTAVAYSYAWEAFFETPTGW